MAEMFTSAEMTGMLLVFGYCSGSGRESVRVYREKFPNRRIPNHQTFAAIERRLRETGSFIPVTANYGRQRTIRTPEVEEEILERIAEDPKLSTRHQTLRFRGRSIQGCSSSDIERTTASSIPYPKGLPFTCGSRSTTGFLSLHYRTPTSECEFC